MDAELHLEALPSRFRPQMSEERREELYTGWKRAVERAKGWAS